MSGTTQYDGHNSCQTLSQGQALVAMARTVSNQFSESNEEELALEGIENLLGTFSREAMGRVDPEVVVRLVPIARECLGELGPGGEAVRKAVSWVYGLLAFSSYAENSSLPNSAFLRGYVDCDAALRGHDPGLAANFPNLAINCKALAESLWAVMLAQITGRGREARMLAGAEGAARDPGCALGLPFPGIPNKGGLGDGFGDWDFEGHGHGAPWDDDGEGLGDDDDDGLDAGFNQGERHKARKGVGHFCGYDRAMAEARAK
ncbi:MAG: hypothetical protein LBU69_04660, partial [Deltaproteobacteria bacterium]|nr:hypothetical protein [Deltaproteobacteria bacterium]